MSRRLVSTALITLLPSTLVLGQQTTPAAPHLIRIVREQIDPTKAGLHRAATVQYRQALEGNKSPMHYEAWISATGSSETWFVTSYERYAEWAADAGHPTAFGDLARQRLDAVATSTTILATLRLDLSYQPSLFTSGANALSVMVVRTRPGHASDYVDERRIVKAAHEKAGTQEQYCVYQVTAGMPTGTFLMIIPYENLGQLDAVPAIHGSAYDAALGVEGRTRSRDLTASGTLRSETQLFVIDPDMSYPVRLK